MSASILALQEKAPRAAAIDVGAILTTVVQSLIFVAIGLVVFAIAFWLITKVAPFSIRKEIEDDQNTALAVVIGSIIIGLAIVIAAAISG